MKKLLITILSLLLLSYSNSQNEEQLYDNYCRALDNFGSTYQNYLVVNIDDKSSGLTNEFCLTGSELVSTMMDEWNLDIDDELKALKKIKLNKNRNFKVERIKNHEFLQRIKYSKKELTNYSNKINFDSIVKNISTLAEWSYSSSNEKEQVMLAHLLFNKGYLTGINECLGGEQLEYYD